MKEKRAGGQFRTSIGRITSGPGLVWLRNGKPEPLDWHGFEHY